MSWPDFVFKKEVDLGHFLTFVTLLAGFIAAGYNVVVRRRKESEETAKSGALRLMLAILRETNGPMTLDELYSEFQSPQKDDLRRVYCEKPWKFKSRTQFEGAVYQLHWEMKADFVDKDSIEFRLKTGPGRLFSPTAEDEDTLLEVAESAIRSEHPDRYLIEDLVATCFKVAPERTSELVRRLLHDSNPNVARIAAVALKQFVE